MLIQKIYKSGSEAQPHVQRWKDMGYEVVFTNGCFDILHEGHIQTLTQAAAIGDKLIVGLNSDESVQILKGPSRPLNKEKSRSVVLAALEAVDMVVIFSEETPAELLELLIPDVLVKGGDYKKSEIVGAELVEKYGGRVEVIPFLKGHSTTGIIKKMKKSDQ
ncbi:MAG: D-glycero-beta-D-manno-heptose 1-phosphate adenylyltransferase [Saprospiraceae bacterium]|nr:D-glycero-beta-D-manno-heptose 1-phosphate adenylyltransferase [Saprospiraceae bacterium]